MLNRIIRGQRASLTRAKRSGSRDQVVLACAKAVREWNGIGVWPDDWNTWQIALDDALGNATVALEDLA